MDSTDRRNSVVKTLGRSRVAQSFPGAVIQLPSNFIQLALRVMREIRSLLEVLPQQAWVLDSKWKRLDAADRQNKYGLSQADFYQLFAYGQKYLAGRGEMALIYPMTVQFTQALPPFDFSPELRLWVLPFDLDKDVLRAANEVGFMRCLSQPDQLWPRSA